MKKTLLKASLKALGAFAVLGGLAILGSFLLALFLRLVTLAWHWGWRLFAVLAIVTTARGQTTPVLFSLQSLTGTVNNRTVTLVPDTANAPFYVGTNLLVLTPLQLYPTNGVVTTNLVPWGYSMFVAGWPRSVHIVVPASTNTLNVMSLVSTNLYSPVNFYTFVAAATNFANLNVTNSTSLDNGTITTDGQGDLTMGSGNIIFSVGGSWRLGGYLNGQSDGSFGQIAGGLFSVDAAGNITGKSLVVNSTTNLIFPAGIDLADVIAVNGDWTFNSSTNGTLQFWRIFTNGGTNDGLKATIDQVGNMYFPSYAAQTNKVIRSGLAGWSVQSIVGGTNYWVNDKGGGVFTTNHIP